MVEQPNPQTIVLWLEWAAVRLIAMPTGRLRPAEPRAYWPDITQEPLAGLSDLQINRIRALAPSAAEIPIIDEIILLPNLCSKPDVRRVIHWRAQIHPIRHHHLLKWDWISHKLNVHKYTAQRWYKTGLQEVADKAPQATVCRITTFMQDNT